MSLGNTKVFIAQLAIGVLSLMRALEASSANEPAGIVLTHGAVYTVDAARSWASAVAVKDGRIVYVGSDAGAKAYVGSSTRVIDLAGRMVMPGLQDSHLHPSEAANPRTQLNLSGVRLPEAVLQRIQDFAKTRPELPWIIGKNIEPGIFSEHGLPTRQQLDRVVSDRPALMYEASLHLASANTPALDAAGVTRETRNPPNGRIGRDSSGEINGLLYELTAIELISSRIPAPTLETRANDLSAALAQMAQNGITSAEDARTLPETAKAYKLLDDRGALPVRVNLCLYFEPDADDDRQFEQFVTLRRSLKGSHLSADCVKFVLDGGYGAHGLFLLAPYSDEPGIYGLGKPTVEAQRLNAMVSRLDAAGFQIHVHTNGDGAVRAALDALAAARKANGPRDNRPTFAHLALVAPEDVERFRRLGVIANMTPVWSRGDAWETELAPRLFGPERAARNYPTRTLLDTGVVLVWGTDWPVTTLSPFEGIETAVTHRYPGGLDPSGKPDTAWNPSQRVSIEQAIVAYTSAGAYLLHEEHQRGSLAAGMSADLIVLSHNLFDLAPAEIHTARVELTMLEGRITYSASSFPAAGQPSGTRGN